MAGMMPTEVQDGILQFVSKHIAGVKHLSVIWFGGEPLLAWDIICSMSDKLMRIAEENGCKYEVAMISNGTLFDDTKIEKLKELNVSKFYKRLIKNGLLTDLSRAFSRLRGNACGADQINSFTIGPDGYIYKYWNDGHSKRATAEVYKVSTTTLQKWKSQLKETGNLEPKKRRETWRKIEPVRLKEYLKQHPDAYLKEIAEEFGCSDVAVLQALRRLKIARKKNYPLQGN